MKYIFFLSLLLVACATRKQLPISGTMIDVKSITVQRVLPGVEDQLPYNRLMIRLEQEDEVVLDSVYYLGDVYLNKPSSKAVLTLSYGVPRADTTFKGSPSSVYLFYHQNKKGYYQYYEGVEQLPTAVMP